MPKQWILKGDRDEKYVLYIEAYAYDYIKKKRESLPALFLYGSKQPGDRERLLVYGVSHTAQDKDLFAPYQLIDGLRICKTSPEGNGTVAFEMEEASGVHKIKGYYVFYEDNPVMKQWLVREQGYAARPVLEACEAAPVLRKKKKKREEKGTAEKAVDFGLIAILLILLSVVIDTLNSPVKLSAFTQHLQQIQKMLMR